MGGEFERRVSQTAGFPVPVECKGTDGHPEGPQSEVVEHKEGQEGKRSIIRAIMPNTGSITREKVV